MENREEGHYWVELLGVYVVAYLKHKEVKGAGKIEVFLPVGTDAEFLSSEFDKIGPRIEPPVPEHVCEMKKLVTCDDMKVRFDACYCGRVLFMSHTTERQRAHVLDLRATPGAVFQVIEGEL